jgi:hypothetical protein
MLMRSSYFALSAVVFFPFFLGSFESSFLFAFIFKFKLSETEYEIEKSISLCLMVFVVQLRQSFCIRETKWMAALCLKLALHHLGIFATSHTSSTKLNPL